MAGQEEVYEILKSLFPRYVDYKEIMILSKRTRPNVVRALKVLRHREEIEYKIIKSQSLYGKWTTVYRVKKEEEKDE